MWVVVTAVPFGFLLGGLLGRSLVSIAASSAPHPTALPVAPARRFRLLLLIFVLVGWLEELHQFIGAGTVPLLSGNIDAARVSLPGGPTIILTDLLIVAAATSFFVAPHPFDRQVRVEFLLGVTALAGLALEGGRGTIIQSVTIAFIARWLYVGRPRTRSIVAILAIGLTLVSAAFFVRTAQHSNDALGIELRDRVLPATPVLLRPLLPLDLALATNFEALARVVDDFPNNEPYGRGLYSAHGLDLFIRNARDLTTVTAQLSPPWVTSTAAGPFWADGGLILVVAGFILIGAISTAAFAIARITRAAADALVAASFVFLAGFCVYQNLFTQQMDWVVVAPLLFLAGATAEGVSPGPRIAAIRRLVRPGDLGGCRSWSGGGSTG